MTEENNSIHDYEFELIADFYSRVKRQGPGSPEITLKALSFIPSLGENARIIDIGCGTGGQTMTLAKHTQGQVWGLDVFPKFIDLFNQQAKQLQLEKRVKGKLESMDALSFEQESLDLIWSEGAIYFMGFEQGLRAWHKFLKKGAYVAVSEATWFTQERPQEIQDFWDDAYPGIDTMQNKVEQMAKAGYKVIAAFNIPDECWTKHFYEPMQQVMMDYLEEHQGNAAAEGFIANQRHEEQLYYKYKAYYGYTFYIGQKL